MVLIEEAALPDGTLSLSLPFGCDIRTAAGKAIERAQETGLSVRFVFNEVPFVITGKNDPEAVERVYLSHKSALATHGTAAFEALFNDKLAKNTEQAQSMLAALPNCIADEEALVAWIGAFALLNLATGFDLKALAAQLEAAGYVADDMTVDPVEAPTKRQQARYVIGQAISALRNGHAMHPVLCAHAEQYKKARPDDQVES